MISDDLFDDSRARQGPGIIWSSANGEIAIGRIEVDKIYEVDKSYKSNGVSWWGSEYYSNN